jgi:hypothetical protein
MVKDFNDTLPAFAVSPPAQELREFFLAMSKEHATMPLSHPFQANQ